MKAQARWARLHPQRCADHCCASCRWSVPEYEGECDCEHPARPKVDHGGYKEPVYITSSLYLVCDLWEPTNAH